MKSVSFSLISNLMRTFSNDVTIEEELETKYYDGPSKETLNKHNFDKCLVLFFEKKEIKKKDDVIRSFPDVVTRMGILRFCEDVISYLKENEIFVSVPSTLRITNQYVFFLEYLKSILRQSTI